VPGFGFFFTCLPDCLQIWGDYKKLIQQGITQLTSKRCGTVNFSASSVELLKGASQSRANWILGMVNSMSSFGGERLRGLKQL